MSQDNSEQGYYAPLVEEKILTLEEAATAVVVNARDTGAGFAKVEPADLLRLGRAIWAERAGL